MFGKIFKKAKNIMSSGGEAASASYHKVRDSYPVKKALGENSYLDLNLIKMDEDGIPTSLNKKGKGLLIGATALAAVNNAINERQTNDMGTSDGRITSLTPDYSAYAKAPSASYSSAPAGADGSLVFALDRAKNGGYL